MLRFPYFLQEAGDRAYIASHGDKWKQLNVSSRSVAGLIRYNSVGFRHEALYDKKFIQVLLISFIGAKKVLADELDALAIEFIKGKWCNCVSY